MLGGLSAVYFGRLGRRADTAVKSVNGYSIRIHVYQQYALFLFNLLRLSVTYCLALFHRVLRPLNHFTADDLINNIVDLEQVHVHDAV